MPYALNPARPHSPDVDAVHPFGKIPAMRHGAVRYFRSPAIRLRTSASCGLARCSGTTAPQDEQYKSPAFKVDRHTRQDTLDFPPSTRFQISER